MATSNTAVDISELDFDEIKTKLKNYLKNQSTFTDYDFEGSGLSTLLNVLAYNTHYNAYYLNMVANEMFLDTAIKRSSVISHAKLLNYTPVSSICAKARVDISFYGVSTPTVTIPKYTAFYSSPIDSINYNFVNSEEIVISTVSSTAIGYYIELVQGQPITYSYNFDLSTNPKQIFKLPDTDIDTSTIVVYVKPTALSTDFVTYTLSTHHIHLNSETLVYFLQESLDGYYEIYFGDGILGKSLSSGNYITIQYLATKGELPNGADKFTLMQSVGSYSSIIIDTVQNAIGGKYKESVESIKYNAPKVYSSHGRAVTKGDYVDIIISSTSIIPIESVSVWGGEEEIPPKLGYIFIALKPIGGYTITNSQKEQILKEVIKPISIITVTPEIVDVDYTFINVNATVLFNLINSILTSDLLLSQCKTTIKTFCNSTLNTFNSIFVLPDLIYAIKQTDVSIVTVDANISLTKKLLPILNFNNVYEIKFGVPIKKDFNVGSISTSYFNYISDDGFEYVDVKIEGVPTILNSVESITIKNTGFGYTTIPTVTIVGDGTGAQATATVVNNRVMGVVIVSSGSGYTQAIVKITGGGGRGAIALATLTGSTIKLRTFYFSNQIKTIINNDVGSLNFNSGVVLINNFIPSSIKNDLGYFSVTVVPDTSIITSSKDTIVSLDNNEPSSIVVSLKSL